MGRQIQIATSQEDENELLEFIRTGSEVQLFEHFAPSPSGLQVEQFSETLPGHFHYLVWNKAFSWTPIYAKNKKGQFYISNSGSGPLLEFSRSDLTRKACGRIYWAKDFSAANDLDYDVGRFETWFDGIVRWVRSHAENRALAHSKIWVFPNAAKALDGATKTASNKPAMDKPDPASS